MWGAVVCEAKMSGECGVSVCWRGGVGRAQVSLHVDVIGVQPWIVGDVGQREGCAILQLVGCLRVLLHCCHHSENIHCRWIVSM